MFQVLILTGSPENSENVVFEGSSSSVLLPGVDGEFEVLDFHKPIISRLKKGIIAVDIFNEYPIKGGVAAMSRQQLMVMVDL